MNQKPSIFLTGGAGLLATNWFYSKRNEYEVYLGLNKKKINPEGGQVIDIDYTSINVLFKQIEVIQPTAIIHTAGLTSVEKCEINPDLAYYTNVELSSMVAQVAKQLAIPFVHISTDHLFEGNTSMLSEDEPTRAINVYGKTKAMAEQSVLNINPDVLIIRSNFYAWGTSYRKSFSDFIIQSLQNKETINLFDDVYYTPILADYLIQTVHDLLEIKAKGIFHVVSDDRISKYDFGYLLAQQFSLDTCFIQKSNFESNSNLVRRPADMSLSNVKVRKILGRNLGTVKQHVAHLYHQKFEAKTQEIQLL